jgi:hypothetical protein
MSKLKDNPILVTGAHRSGSTWAGVMISAPNHISYVNEPFNILYTPGSCRPHFKNWYTYVCQENEAPHVKYIEDCISYKPHQFGKTIKHGSIGDIPRVLKFQIDCYKARLTSKRPLVKDPLAVFSSEWLADRFNMDVVVLIRHPAAFVGSLKVADWPFQFDHLTNQPLLIERLLSAYEDEIQDFAENEHDLVDQAILLWNLVYSTVQMYQEKYGDKWIFIRHEDLSRSPLEEYRKIFKQLGIPFTEKADFMIKKYSYDAEDQSRLSRDSKTNIWKWKSRLTEDEIARIKARTHHIAKDFYQESDW